MLLVIVLLICVACDPPSLLFSVLLIILYVLLSVISSSTPCPCCCPSWYLQAAAPLVAELSLVCSVICLLFCNISPPLLVGALLDMMNSHKNIWVGYGCSTMVDSWTSRIGKSIINFLVNLPARSTFVKSVDASVYSKTGEKVFEYLMSLSNMWGSQYCAGNYW